jgi:hypothetical protein
MGQSLALWERHYAEDQKVADSRPDEVKEFFAIYLMLPAALGPGVFSASNRIEYQKHKILFPMSIARPVCTADNLTAIYEPIV